MRPPSAYQHQGQWFRTTHKAGYKDAVDQPSKHRAHSSCHPGGIHIGLWCETRAVAVVDHQKKNWRPPCRTDFSPPARNFHTKTACALRCRRAARAADVEPSTALQQPFDKLRANGFFRDLLRSQKQANFGRNNSHNPHTASASSYIFYSVFRVRLTRCPTHARPLQPPAPVCATGRPC